MLGYSLSREPGVERGVAFGWAIVFRELARLE